SPRCTTSPSLDAPPRWPQPTLLRGDAVEVMPDAFARVPADALPVVTTTWALSHFPLESRLRFLHRLDEAAWRCSTGRLCAPRPLAAAGRRGRMLAWLADSSLSSRTRQPSPDKYATTAKAE